MANLLRPLCDIADVRAEIGVLDDDKVSDDAIIVAINEASRFIEDFCGRQFIKITDPQTVRRANPADVLMDSEFYLNSNLCPIRSVSSVTEDDASLTLWEDYGYDSNTGLFVRYGGDATSRASWGSVIVVAGEFGYDGTSTAVAVDMPGKIRTACKEIAANFTGENKREKVGYDGSTVSVLDKNVPRSAMKYLAGYRKLII